MLPRILTLCVAAALLAACMGETANHKWDHLDYDRITKGKMSPTPKFSPTDDDGV